METNLEKQENRSKEYLKNCFMQKCQDEFDSFKEDEESSLDKYSRLSIKLLPIISLLFAISLVLLETNFNINILSQFIGLLFLTFFTAVFLIVRLYMKYKDNRDLKLDIYDSWTKTIFLIVIVSLGLFFFKSNASPQILLILSFAAIAMVVIQKGKRE